MKAVVGLLLLFVAEAAFAVSGATVTSVGMEGGKIHVTILNRSGHQIVAWMIRLKERLDNGSETSIPTYGEDYWPEGKGSGTTFEAEISDNLEEPKIEAIEAAEVIFAVYSDQTVQIKDGEEAKFKDWSQAQQQHAASLVAHARDLEAKGDTSGGKQIREQAKWKMSMANARRIP